MKRHIRLNSYYSDLNSALNTKPINCYIAWKSKLFKWNLASSSYSFCKEIPTSRIPGGISMGLNFPPRPKELYPMLSYLTLLVYVCMKQNTTWYLSLLFNSGECNTFTEIMHSLLLLRSEVSLSHMLKNTRTSGDYIWWRILIFFVSR